MTDQNTASDGLCCLECNHRFSDDEVAAITARASDLACILTCTSCGSHNLVRSAPRPGFETPPGLIVVRVASGDIDVADAFKEDVEAGVYVHPRSAGSSN